MASSIKQEHVDFFKNTISAYEPYPIDILAKMGFDDGVAVDNKRYAATIALKTLLDAGFSEGEVNPWNK